MGQHLFLVIVHNTRFCSVTAKGNLFSSPIKVISVLDYNLVLKKKERKKKLSNNGKKSNKLQKKEKLLTLSENQPCQNLTKTTDHTTLC